ncbi:Hypothetical predicted protein [Octopus vulgaris]|uniref:Uncharacterized protein n=1 Tax=Octopus vulgaris TaxID=6645 RepID=A0AA36EVJ5_OCTVU|nr:Hypothetical predicted protein [Octopus vulgaris]
MEDEAVIEENSLNELRTTFGNVFHGAFQDARSAISLKSAIHLTNYDNSILVLTTSIQLKFVADVVVVAAAWGVIDGSVILIANDG